MALFGTAFTLATRPRRIAMTIYTEFTLNAICELRALSIVLAWTWQCWRSLEASPARLSPHCFRRRCLIPEAASSAGAGQLLLTLALVAFMVVPVVMSVWLDDRQLFPRVSSG